MRFLTFNWAPQEKARQLRFLQYRGFAADVCFDALKYDLTTLANR